MVESKYTKGGRFGRKKKSISSFFLVLIEFRRNQGKERKKRGNTSFLWGKKAFWVDCDKIGNRSCPGVSPSFPLFIYLQTPHITQSSSSSRFERERERETRLPDPLNSLQLLFINDRISSQSSKRKHRKENSYKPAQLTFTLLPSPPFSKKPCANKNHPHLRSHH